MDSHENSIDADLPDFNVLLENEDDLIEKKEQLQVQELSDWLDANPHINGCKAYDSLHFFLRTCKFDVERAKSKLKTFYQMRAERTEWFDNCDPMLPEIQELLTLGVFLPVDGVDEQQRKVVIIRTAAHDPKRHSQNNVFKVYTIHIQYTQIYLYAIVANLCPFLDKQNDIGFTIKV